MFNFMQVLHKFVWVYVNVISYRIQSESGFSCQLFHSLYGSHAEKANIQVLFGGWSLHIIIYIYLSNRFKFHPCVMWMHVSFPEIFNSLEESAQLVHFSH